MRSAIFLKVYKIWCFTRLIGIQVPRQSFAGDLTEVQCIQSAFYDLISV